MSPRCHYMRRSFFTPKVAATTHGRRGSSRADPTDGCDAALADHSLARLDLLEGRVAAWRRDLHARPRGLRRGPPALASVRRLDRELLGLETSGRRRPSARQPAGAAVTARRRPRARHTLCTVRSAGSCAGAVGRARFRRQGHARRIFQGTDRREVLGWILLAEKRPRDAAVEFRASRMLSDGPANTRRWPAMSKLESHSSAPACLTRRSPPTSTT